VPLFGVNAAVNDLLDKNALHNNTLARMSLEETPEG
jgi:hypothetical protein